MEKENKVQLPVYEKKEEALNVLTHFIGAVIFSVATAPTVYFATLKSKKLGAIAFFYCLSLIILYSTSTIYHLSKNYSLRVKTQKADHMTINILILGSNVMYLVGALNSYYGNILIGIVAFFSLLSFLLNLFNVNRFRIISMISYIVGGWMSIIAIKFLYPQLGAIGVFLLLLGGIIYTGGLSFYSIKKKYMHAIWHVFVLIASILQYASALIFILS